MLGIMNTAERILDHLLFSTLPCHEHQRDRSSLPCADFTPKGCASPTDKAACGAGMASETRN